MTRRLFTLLLLLGAEVGSFMVMLRVPAGSLGEIPNLPPEDAVLVVVRLVTLAVAGWLTASTVLYGLASAARLPGLVRGVQWLTLPGIRRLVDGLVTTTVIATTTLNASGAASAMPSASAGAGVATPAAPPSLYVPRPAGNGIPAPSPVPGAGSHPYRPQPAGDGLVPTPPPPSQAATPASSPRLAGDSEPLSRPARASQPPVPAPVPPPPSPAPVPSASTYVLRPGDHLWSVAARQVADHLGLPVQDLSPAEIGRYWTRLADLNGPHLRSGNPDIVYPGEVMTLPGPLSPS